MACFKRKKAAVLAALCKRSPCGDPPYTADMRAVGFADRAAARFVRDHGIAICSFCASVRIVFIQRRVFICLLPYAVSRMRCAVGSVLLDKKLHCLSGRDTAKLLTGSKKMWQFLGVAAQHTARKTNNFQKIDSRLRQRLGDLRRDPVAFGALPQARPCGTARRHSMIAEINRP